MPRSTRHFAVALSFLVAAVLSPSVCLGDVTELRSMTLNGNADVVADGSAEVLRLVFTTTVMGVSRFSARIAFRMTESTGGGRTHVHCTGGLA